MTGTPPHETPAEQIGRLRDEVDRLKAAEEQLRASLSEKDALLNGIHHRVRNDLQVISSFVSLIGMKAENPESVTLFREINDKIHTMALVHSQLYRRDRYDEVDMKTHVEELTSHLHRVYTGGDAGFRPLVKGDNVSLSVNQAIPCALALNEIISSVYKHGNDDAPGGKIEISIEESTDRQVSVCIGGSCPGIPGEAEPRGSDALGMHLVRSLVERQLKGSLEFGGEGGTRIRLTFRIASPVSHKNI